MGKSVSKGLRSIAKGLTGGGGTSYHLLSLRLLWSFL